MKPVAVKGIIPPVVTPMKEDGTVNEQELKNQIRRQIQAGVHGIFTSGTNGEGYILTREEKEQVLELAVEEAGGRVPVYAGTGCISTRETIQQSRRARDIGADVLSVITPFFASASQEELYGHYKAVAEAVPEMPVILYNIPARAGNFLAPATVERLGHIDNIIGIKDSSGNFDNMLRYMEETRAGKAFAVLSGNDSLILWNLAAGGSGGVSGCANVFPEVMVSIFERFTAGDMEGARKAQDSIRSFRNCFRYGNPNTVVKTAVALLGYPVGPCRAPFNQISREGMEALKQVLAENAEKGMCRFV